LVLLPFLGAGLRLFTAAPVYAAPVYAAPVELKELSG